ncbi:MAG: EAL domain-containing protein [Calditrichaeota bacterium]|nr:EAL domain-containing protein [Calditrichota bacterium]
MTQPSSPHFAAGNGEGWQARRLTGLFSMHQTYVETFLAELRDFGPYQESQHASVNRYYLQFIARFAGVEQAQLVHFNDAGKHRLLEAVGDNPELHPTELLPTLRHYFPEFHKNRFPVIIPGNPKHPPLAEMDALLIPLEARLDHFDFLILYGAGFHEFFLDNTFATLLRGLYGGTGRLSRILPEGELWNQLVDRLKLEYNFVEQNLFDRRFNAFREELSNIRMVFEPIVSLDRDYQSLTIWGWEALARDGRSGKTPLHLFEAAELWGMQFQTELDCCCLRLALETYHQENRRSRTLRGDQPKPLSVNVFPNTILRSRYRKFLHQLLKEEKLLPRNTLILELSEKTLIHSDSVVNENLYLSHFKRVMESLREEFRLDFAIDDFGAGYSSISRLNRLVPGYLKIDRDILMIDPHQGQEVIRYVKQFARKIPGRGIQIIVEGFDNKSNSLSLKELIYQLDVDFLQGHFFGKAGANLHARISDQKWPAIKRELGWE